MLFFFKYGEIIRLFLKPSKQKRVTSEIQFSFKFLFFLGKILKILKSLISTLIFTCIESFKSIVFNEFNSQDLAIKEYGFEVNAPTGQRSIKLPDISDKIILLEKFKISIELPLPAKPKYLKPAISSMKRTQRVQ